MGVRRVDWEGEPCVTVRRLLALASVCALGVSVAACGNSGNGSATTTTSHSGTSIPDRVPNQDSVRRDVTIGTCSAVPGGWSAGGTIKNTLGHDATYEITIFFTSAAATDLAYGATSDGGESRQERALDGDGEVRGAEHGAVRPTGCLGQLTGAPAGRDAHFDDDFASPFTVVLVVVGTACVDAPIVQGYGFHGSDWVLV
ncbi:MAG TPA: hypothetical protein VIY26_12380 [Acidimicrobiales bacterium]